jgi:hypothetical protein
MRRGSIQWSGAELSRQYGGGVTWKSGDIRSGKGATTVAPNSESGRKPESDRPQLENVEAPGTEVDVQTVVDEVVAIAKVTFGRQGIDEMYCRAPQFREWQFEAALSPITCIIDDNDMAAA